MKTLIGEVELVERASGLFVPASIYHGLDQKNFDDFEQLWRPRLKAARASVATWAEAAALNAQDSHWDWKKIAVEAEKTIGEETYALEAAGQTQGLMLISEKFARLPTQLGRELVYVEFVSTAPWNRPELVTDPRYKGVGIALLGTAISKSVELGFGGRIGLHSLQQSESWYQDIEELTDVEYDTAKKMRYFEMTEAGAMAFVSG
jgi:hypothetical protein